MYANTQFYQGYPQSQAPNTSGMNASPAPIPDHTQLNLPQPGAMAGNFDPTLGQQYPNGKPKRKQVKNACTNCQKACKKCDDQRPCPRCVKYGQTESCVDSVRKERQKGIKRGPYKKRKQGDGIEGSNNNTGLSNPMYPPPPTTGDNRAAMAAYQAYANAAGAQFENFPGFQNSPHYQLPFNILNNMNHLIQQAAVNASSANGGTKDQQQQQGMDGGNKNNNINNNMINKISSTEVVENGKLNILSQLCTAVLDHDPNAANKNDTPEENKDSKDQVSNPKDDSSKPVTTATAPGDVNVPQSASHSRESTSTDNNNNNNESSVSTESTAAPAIVEKTDAADTTGKEPESEDDRGSSYGTPEAGENDTSKNN